MKSFALMAAALALGFTLATGDAEAAKRLGSGKSSGMQRESVTAPQKSPSAAPAPSQATAPAAAAPAAAGAAAKPKSSWMGPLAGLAAGLGLAALASHFGFGEELASMLMIGLLVMAVVMVIGFVMRRRAASQGSGANYGGMQYAGAGGPLPGSPAAGAAEFHQIAGGSSAGQAAGPAANIPAGFDVDGFVRNAKVNFIRLQAANDAGNLDDIREFTTPEMFAEIKMGMGERGQDRQETDVVQVDAEVLDVSEETSRYVVSVRFTGFIREAANAPADPFDEIWHLIKARDGKSGWILAGIQQVQ